MASPPTTPRSPYHYKRPRSSTGYDISTEDFSWNPSSPGAHHESLYQINQSPRASHLSHSARSARSPTWYRRMSSKSSRPPSLHLRKTSGTSVNSAGSSQFGKVNGLGNLADELEHVLHDEYEQLSSFQDGLRDGPLESPIIDTTDMDTAYCPLDSLGAGFGLSLQSSVMAEPITSVPPLLASPRRLKHSRENSRIHGHKRHESAYDGSDYGPESDLEDVSESLPPILKKRMRDVESVTRMSVNTEDAVSEKGGVIKRTIHALKELNPQINIEYGVTRLVTAYTSMALHRTHKTRDIFAQSHSLLYGGIMDLPEEIVDLLLNDIDSLIESVPSLLQQNPLLSLQILTSQTVELTQTLRSLTDLLQESKIATNVAARQLKSVKDMVDDLRMEEELCDNSIMLIQAGDWDRRCKQRQAAKTCREVVDGFAELWNVDLETVDVDAVSVAVHVEVSVA